MYNTIKSEEILYWYFKNKNKRNMPWRLTKDPYKIWVSEVMLQQTQVKTVIPYYKKWIEAYPNIKSVALSNPDMLLKHWEGLGYYSRCRNFYKAAKIVNDDYGGVIPRNYNDFLSLPGVGEYTAGAIFSIAFKEKTPAIDTNINRLLFRIMGLKKQSKYNNTRILHLLNRFLNCNEPGNINQALMDIGNLFCKSKNPRCRDCIFNNNCKAYQSGSPEKYPHVKRKNIVKKINLSAAIIIHKGLLLIKKRINSDLYKGFWQVPLVEIDERYNTKQIINKYKDQFQLKLIHKSKLGTIKHILSHRIISVNISSYEIITYEEELDNYKWASNKDLLDLPFSVMDRKILEYYISS